MEKTQEKTFPFRYHGWDEGGGDYGDVQFYQVDFTEDFGPIKKGESFSCVMVQHCDGRLIAYKTPIEETHVIKWKAVAV